MLPGKSMGTAVAEEIRLKFCFQGKFAILAEKLSGRDRVDDK